jgi:hypothetical protein
VTSDLTTTNGASGGKLCTVPLGGGPHVLVEDLGARGDWGLNHIANALCADGPVVFVAAWPTGIVYRRDTTQAQPATLLATLPLSRTGTGTSSFSPVHAQVVAAGPFVGHIAFAGLNGDVVVLDRLTGAVLGHWFDNTVPGTGLSALKNSVIQNPNTGDWITGTRDGYVDVLVPVGGGQRAQRDIAGSRRQVRLDPAIGTTTPDVIYRAPHHADDEGIAIYLDGLSGRLHGNPATREQDLRIRTWLRNNGWDVIEIAESDLHDVGAMTRHFRRLAGYLRADEVRTRVQSDPGWFTR